MSWLEKLLPPKIQQTDPNERRSIPKKLWIKYPTCETILYKTDLEQNLNIYPKCSHHHHIGTRAQLDNFLDGEGHYKINQEIVPVDALKFKNSKKYPKRLKEALENTNETDTLVVMDDTIHNIPIVTTCFEFEFMGDSMDSVVDKRFIRDIETAIEQKTPFISFTATNNAHIQEKLLSLMQMAKTNTTLTRLAKAKLPYINMLTDPTINNISTSFTFVSDVIIAEPKTLISFANPHVIENTMREKLPENFQHAEFLLQTNAIDMIVDRHKLHISIAHQMAMLQQQNADAMA